MRNSLILAFLCYSLTISATTYYIDPSGSDSNNGSSSSPWKTLAYACSKATSSGDIIHVNAGTYTETAQSSLAVGVSIEGAGVTSVIKSHVGGTNWTIQLYSGNQGTNGNQHISNIKMDGDNLTAFGAIGIFMRSNVEIYNCTFINFASKGINFDATGTGTLPTTYSTGNKFHDNTVTNCSGYDPPNSADGALSALWIAGQQTMLIYNNTLDQTQRAPGYNGFLIKGVGGFNKDIKIYNNILNKAPYDGTTWDFAIEMWSSLGGIEIYNNTMTGSIDFSGAYGNVRGAYSYGVWIHNNIIGEATNSSQTTRWTRGVQFEQTSDGIIIEKNWFKNMGSAIYFPVYHNAPLTYVSITDFTVRYNVFDNIGSASSGASGVYFNNSSRGMYPNVCNGFYIYNNVFIGHVGGTSTGWGIETPDVETTSNVSIRNNIVENFNSEPVYGYYAVNSLSIEKNIFYNNGNSNVPVYSGSGTVQNNLTSNPLFVSSSDFHLQAGSPAIGKGLAITGLTTDYDGNAIKNPPSIGAYESGSAVQAPVVPAYVSSAIANATPSLLEMTYNQTLANIVPAATAFSVMVNSAARTVNTVAISGTKVQLTLSSPIVYGNVITVSYTMPSTNPLQTTSGGQAVTIGPQAVTNNVNSVIPVYVSSVVANATPSLLEMTYNMTLANIVPAATAFSVMVNSTARTVNIVAVSGTKVQLTLSSPIVSGNVITVSYTKPSANPLQTTSGGQAATIGPQAVTNNVNSIIPVYVSSAVANATPSLLEMTYNMTLANIVPAATAFSVMVNSTARTVNTVAISGTKVQLTLSSPIVYGDVVTVVYTKPSTNPLQSTLSGQAVTIGTQAVTNNVNSIIPVYVSSAVANATPSLLEITYNMTLANIVPSTSSFSILVNSVARTINTVVISGTKVQLTLSSKIVSDDIVTVSYIKPSNNAIQTTSGGIAASITNQRVINNCINIAPTAVITSPVLNSSFTSPTNITITANAFDTDGSVSMVEFYNGNTKLGSNSAAPYSFTWNNVAAGNYSLTVIATDNLNAKTTSSVISISVVNDIQATNIHPIVKISNPSKGNTYENLSTIEIDAIASDPDGTISKVDFYNGATELVELTAAPYIYIWKNVAAGSYSIKAIATDNLNDTTISSPVEFVVGIKTKYDANSDIIKLYPNPNNGHFSIEFVNPIQFKNGEIIITDIAGKQVYNGPVAKEEILKQFDLSKNRPGLYVMMIKDKEILVTKKFIKN